MKNLAAIIALIIALIFSAAPATAGGPGKMYERDYQMPWCAAAGGRAEVVLSDRTRVDCLTPTHAVEFDWAKKWAEGIGQALNYSRLTGKRAAVMLIITSPKDLKHLKRARAIAAHFRLPLDVWAIRGKPRIREP